MVLYVDCCNNCIIRCLRQGHSPIFTTSACFPVMYVKSMINAAIFYHLSLNSHFPPAASLSHSIIFLHLSQAENLAVKDVHGSWDNNNTAVTAGNLQ